MNKTLKKEGSALFYMTHKDDLVKTGFPKTEVFNKYTVEDVVEAFMKAPFSNVSIAIKVILKSRK